MRSWFFTVRKRVVRRRPPPRAFYLSQKAHARGVAHSLVVKYAPRYGVLPKRIAIRNTVSRWGSASSLGNINFSVRIVLLPPELQGYIVVHELCHLLEHNHSERFWALVAREVPKHRILRRRLREWERQNTKEDSAGKRYRE